LAAVKVKGRQLFKSPIYLITSLWSQVFIKCRHV
jgi:hypothetical protein